MGKESKSRRDRARARQNRETVATSSSAPPGAREAGPEQLLAKYGAEPIPDLPGEVKKFHLRVVTDVLGAYDQSARSVGPFWAAQTWHNHHDGLAASRPNRLKFGDAEMDLACKPGCNHCCRTPVAVVAAEAVLVAHFVARTFSEQDRLALERRMEARKAAIRAGDRSHLCPLNVDGKCSVYEVRPFNCRMFHSFDVGACERLFHERRGSLPIDRVRKHYDGLIAASASVAFRALKLDTRMIELMPALEIALAAGADRCERLAAGEDLFAGLPTCEPDSPAAGPASE